MDGHDVDVRARFEDVVLPDENCECSSRGSTNFLLGS